MDPAPDSLRPLPRPPGHPLALLLRSAREPLGALEEMREACGDIWLVDLPFVPTVVLAHPDDIRTVLVEDFRSYRKDTMTRQLSRILGGGLLTAEGEVWRRHRRLAQPAFHHQAIRGYAEAMSALASTAVDGWGEQRDLDLHAEMMYLTLEIVSRTLFGHDIGEEARAVSRALDTLMETSRGVANTGFMLPAWVPTPQNHRHACAIAEIDRIVYRIVEAHRQTPDPSTLLGMLISATDADGGFGDAELRDEAVTLLMAGHETTASALTMALYLLSQHPNAEARLLAEVDGVLDGSPPALEHIERLPFVRAVILEAMRLYPPAWSIGRETVRDARIRDHLLPPGTQIWLSPWLTQRDARWFDEPNRFLPERWEGGGLEQRLPDCAFFPFGAGPRVCIGKRFAELEAILVLATIASRYALRLAPGETLRLDPSITLRPRGGLRMVATERRPARRAA